MTDFFTDEEIEHMAQSTVRYATLAQLEFRTSTMRLFAGAGKRDFGGEEWQGLGGLISIDGLTDQRGTAANRVTISLSGVDPQILPKALDDTEEVRNRPITLLWQLLDEDWQAVGRLIPIYWGLMQPPEISRTEATEEEGALCTITLPSESLMVGRSRPAHGRYTDRDQKRRHSGDRFFERIAENKGKVVDFPDYN